MKPSKHLRLFATGSLIFGLMFQISAFGVETTQFHFWFQDKLHDDWILETYDDVYLVACLQKCRTDADCQGLALGPLNNDSDGFQRPCHTLSTINETDCYENDDCYKAGFQVYHLTEPFRSTTTTGAPSTSTTFETSSTTETTVTNPLTFTSTVEVTTTKPVTTTTTTNPTTTTKKPTTTAPKTTETTTKPPTTTTPTKPATTTTTKPATTTKPTTTTTKPTTTTTMPITTTTSPTTTTKEPTTTTTEPTTTATEPTTTTTEPTTTTTEPTTTTTEPTTTTTEPTTTTTEPTTTTTKTTTTTSKPTTTTTSLPTTQALTTTTTESPVTTTSKATTTTQMTTTTGQTTSTTLATSTTEGACSGFKFCEPLEIKADCEVQTKTVVCGEPKDQQYVIGLKAMAPLFTDAALEVSCKNEFQQKIFTMNTVKKAYQPFSGTFYCEENQIIAGVEVCFRGELKYVAIVCNELDSAFEVDEFKSRATNSKEEPKLAACPEDAALSTLKLSKEGDSVQVVIECATIVRK